jgi:peptidoglycan/LPS O-acetylase OafA/YrhL
MTVAGVAFILPPFFLSMDSSRFIYTGGFALLYLGFGALMLVLLICGRERFDKPSRWIRFCAYLGSHSYSIYLWHIPILIWVMRIILPEFGVNLNYWMELVAYVIACFGWGVFVAKGIEFPILRIRDRLFPADSRAIRAPQP